MDTKMKCLRIKGLPIVLWIDENVWTVWGHGGPVDVTLEPLEADQDELQWVPLELACRQLAKDMNDTSAKGVERARYRIQNDLRSPRPTLRDNGKEKRERAVEEGSLSTFRLKVRDRLLESDGWGDDE